MAKSDLLYRAFIAHVRQINKIRGGGDDVSGDPLGLLDGTEC